ncbi:unnamed protein product [Spirodela intermedia]|uniref:Uncharacterized protein n=1 Tax=Spirodela intermedia TaxID=51605 RepID=A0A7I8J5G7_SPIIN|nr:unnamed protein product [Spirodela intermedia]CAA6665476.1 unnamed protein product [Spirodela intermedia]
MSSSSSSLLLLSLQVTAAATLARGDDHGEPRRPAGGGRVIGDVVDMFMPTVNMSVCYGAKHVNNGCDVKPSAAGILRRSTSPAGPRPVMTDPDAPSPSDPTMREWVHWIVVDIPGGTDPSQAAAVHGATAAGGNPPLRLRTVPAAGSLSADSPPTPRSNFCTRDFAAQFDLALPVAGVYYNAQKEPASRRR